MSELEELRLERRKLSQDKSNPDRVFLMKSLQSRIKYLEYYKDPVPREVRLQIRRC